MVVAITGASSGIGRALAVALAARGARLVLAARRLPLLEELDRTLGGGHLCIRADVATEQDCVYLVQAAKARFGRLDTLVCNAGVGLLRAVGETSAEDWRSLFAVNLSGTTDCIRAALPVMRAQEARDGWRGQLMIVSSCLARRGVPDLGAYCATKAAQLSLAEAVQAPAIVAEAMVAAIIRPRPEVWPHRSARWLFSLATLVPGLVDAAMARFRRRIAPPP